MQQQSATPTNNTLNDDDDNEDPTTTTTTTNMIDLSKIYCSCLHRSSMCHDCGQPLDDKKMTQHSIEALISTERCPISNVYGNGPLVLSNVPESSSNKDIVLGIDEAGRGSVLGHMVYGMAYWAAPAAADQEDLLNIPKDFNDSKQLTEKDRDRLFDTIVQHPHIGFGFRALLPSEISRNMLRPRPYNLNEMSHDATMVLIRKVLKAGVSVRTAYIDTVGNPDYYKRKLEHEFPGVDFVVESKADANYAPCSAASVGKCTTTRHCILNNKKTNTKFVTCIF
jgi:ribonuclease HII